jgi:hypothetical protein
VEVGEGGEGNIHCSGVVDSRTKMTGTSKENDQKDPFT